MKKISVILFATLFLAIAGSYILHFTGKKGAVRTSESIAGVPADGIAFVDIDSVIFNFAMFQDKRDELMGKQRTAEAELTSKGTRYERDVRDFQDKVSKGLVTRATAEQMEQTLMQQQQDLINIRDQFSANLMEEEQVMNRQVYDYITKFLEANRDEFNYSYIFGKSFGGVILYGEPVLDITSKVIEGLNKKYQAEKSSR